MFAERDDFKVDRALDLLSNGVVKLQSPMEMPSSLMAIGMRPNHLNAAPLFMIRRSKHPQCNLLDLGLPTWTQMEMAMEMTMDQQLVIC